MWTDLQLTIKYVHEKNANRIYAEIFSNFHDANQNYPGNIASIP